MKDPLIARLQWIGTLRLALLSLITLGVYEAHYIKKQSQIISEHTDHKIGTFYTSTLLIIAAVSAALFVPFIILDESHPISILSNLSDVAFIAFSPNWGFMARRRMNDLLCADPKTEYWFSAIWTLLFTPLYFNYKINKLHETLPNQAL